MATMQDLADLMVRHTPGDGVHATAIPRVTLIRSSHPTEPIHTLHAPAVCIVAQGAKSVQMGERLLRYDAASFLVVSVDVPIVGQVTQAGPDTPYLCLRLDLDPAGLSALITDSAAPASPSRGKGRDETTRGLELSPVTPALVEAAARLLRLLDEPADIDFLAPLAEREIHYRLLRGEQGPTLRHIAGADSRLTRVGRAIAWIKTHYDQPIPIATLAAEAGMSASALHEHFKAITAMSPLQYHKHLRLQEARRLMLAGGYDAGGASYAVGYESPSQFSREYARLFGAPPAKDVARLRAAPEGLMVA
jgi:AraC-like DNA-binding protein